MRELNEYKKEIFALGEKKIKMRRRKIIKTTAICMPLCICFVLYGLYVMPSFVSADKSSPELNEEMDLVGTRGENYTDDFSSFSTTVETPDGISTRIIDDDAKNKLLSIFEVNDGSSDYLEEIFHHQSSVSGAEEETTATENTVPENKKEAYLFKITFEYENGDKDVYTVTENSIIDNFGSKTKISQEKIDEIKKILGKD